MAQQVAQDHRVLKAVVVGLGVLIILGVGALIVGIAVKGGKVAGKPASAPLLLPQDASIADMAISERQLVLHVTMKDREELMLIDLQSGRVVSRIPVMRGVPQE